MEAILKSPLKAFLREVEDALSKETDTSFFLATDDNSVRKNLLAVFGSKIVCQPAVHDRSTVAGAQQAVVDLYCLSHCREIWGSAGSSFTEMAFHLGNADLYVVESVAKKAIRKAVRGKKAALSRGDLHK